MHTGKFIKSLLKAKGMKSCDLALNINKSQGAVSNQLREKSATLSTLETYLRGLGYRLEIVLHPLANQELKPLTFVLTDEQANEELEAILGREELESDRVIPRAPTAAEIAEQERQLKIEQANGLHAEEGRLAAWDRIIADAHNQDEK